MKILCIFLIFKTRPHGSHYHPHHHNPHQKHQHQQEAMHQHYNTIGRMPAQHHHQGIIQTQTIGHVATQVICISENIT